MSTEAYNTLARIKRKNESFSEGHPPNYRKESQRQPAGIHQVEAPDHELADSIEKVAL